MDNLKAHSSCHAVNGSRGRRQGRGKGREEAATVVPARRDASLGVSQVLLEETQEVV